MSMVPIFSVCVANTVVTQLLGSTPTRLYPFGQAPQDVAKPYAVWQVIGGSPENYVSGGPDTDTFSLQVDVYAISGSSASNVGDAIRTAIELDAYTTNFNGDSRDEQTGHYRHSFDVDWIVNR
ncbi:DUF3168 domain-containing protein [Shewanella sp. SG41-4]|jgi:FlaG/FlaF family flagellin (archaellin)|uniref:DUF3168 domain-containing protein n=1 Tax=Shewanella sp. SG41-4 TaxID=2760976 RepID=UPI00160094C8|nr:DUF3168 domain-containing protein [Shewanella sp. SG41-4]MBB1438903.1 DUF3168 domain-containing protein [Shewanella sp. SG41-4]